MSGWTEETLRAAASWKAFKEGKSLFDSGAVAEAKASPSGWRGAVKAGARPIRVSVTVKSPTDFETRCPCPANQSTGELCAHAVATGLAALAPAAASPARPVPAVRETPALAREVLLPPNWRESLARGKLTATLTHSRNSEVSPADLRLAAWLAAERVTDKENLNLHLDAPRAAAFLDALSGHPAVFAGKEHDPVSITAGRRLGLSDTRPQGEKIVLAPDPASGDWISLDDSFWQIGPDSLNSCGEGGVPATLAPILNRLARGESAAISLSDLIENLDSWQEWLGFPDGGWLDSLHFLPATPVFKLSLEGSLQHLEARLAVAYGHAPPLPPGLGKVENLPRLVGDHCEVRDLAAEENAVRRLENAGFQVADRGAGTWALTGESAILDFLARTLPELRESWSVSEGPRFSHVRREVAVVSPSIEILGSGEDWLSFDLQFQTSDGSSVSADEIRRLLRSGRSTGKGPGGKRWVASGELLETLEPLFSDLDLEQKSGHFEASAHYGEMILEIQNNLRK